MSSELAIEVSGVSKVFPVYERPHHRLLQFALGNRRRLYREFWALRDVSFSVRRGEAVGIVGRNGSGKSTLLQVLCGTLSETSGSVKVSGRVSALLELGAGFNPDFTGRENAFLNGSLMGLSRADLEAKMPSIEAFADIGEFIDQPVKCYSSGMFVRLAFAVAVSVEPDILVVDEALSVGDEAFQRKCFSRIQSMRENGLTILFVSHSASAVTELCNRAILLDRGEKLLEGTPKFVVSRYHKLLFARPENIETIRKELGQVGEAAPDVAERIDPTLEVTVMATESDDFYDPDMVPRSTVRYVAAGAHIDQPHLLSKSGKRVNVVSSGRRYTYTYSVRFERAAFNVRFGMLIRTVTGLELAGAVTALAAEAIPCVEAGAQVRVQFDFDCLLTPGAYFVNAGVLAAGDSGEQFLDRVIDAVMFRVQTDQDRLATGIVDLHVKPSVVLERSQS